MRSISVDQPCLEIILWLQWRQNPGKLASLLRKRPLVDSETCSSRPLVTDSDVGNSCNDTYHCYHRRVCIGSMRLLSALWLDLINLWICVCCRLYWKCSPEDQDHYPWLPMSKMPQPVCMICTSFGHSAWLGRVVSMLDSGAEGPGFKLQPRHCWVSLRQTVHTHRASVHQAVTLVAALLKVCEGNCRPGGE